MIDGGASLLVGEIMGLFRMQGSERIDEALFLSLETPANASIRVTSQQITSFRIVRPSRFPSVADGHDRKLTVLPRPLMILGRSQGILKNDFDVSCYESGLVHVHESEKFGHSDGLQGLHSAIEVAD